MGTEEREWQTRRRRIDGRLQARAWSVVSADSPRKLTPEAVTEYETDHGPADYALSVNGQILVVVEAAAGQVVGRVAAPAGFSAVIDTLPTSPAWLAGN